MKILVIDDERSIGNSLKEILADEGYDVDVAENGVQGCEMVEKEKYRVIFCDIKMPEMDGMEVLDKLTEMGIDSAVIMISGHGDIDTAVECIKRGAFDFIQKPLDLNRIFITIKNATEKVSLVRETKILKKKVYGQQMVGESVPIAHVKEMIDKVAPTDARVLIIGSNGTGKELVARSLHQKSSRSSMPKEPSRPQSSSTRANSSRLTRERSSLTKSETCHLPPRQKCCVCFRRGNSRVWEATRTSQLT